MKKLFLSVAVLCVTLFVQAKDYADYVEINLGDGRMLQSQYYVQVINNYSTINR